MAGSITVCTLLFTDIEGSTALLLHAGSRYADLLERHRTIIRTALVAARGVEHAADGDSFFFVFDTPSAAIAAATDAQLGLEREPWPEGERVRVRMGVHVGEVAATSAGLVGLAIHQTARIASAAHGGQIVVSDDAKSLATTLPAGVTLRNLGRHDVRDLGRVALHQVVHDDLQVDFPPPAAMSLAVSVPTPATTFVGRHEELEAIAGLVAEHRLVTLTGPGGCGKTRLVIEVAGRLGDEFSDGVRFVDLCAVTDGAGVGTAFVDALGLAADPYAPEPLTRLAAYIVDRELLCIVDNCEHVIDACADVAEAVIARRGRSRLVTTSREPLGVVGEQVYAVPSLSVDTEAVQLFSDRAAEVRSGFAVDESNLPTIVEICRRVDGIPLAIELAAARIAHLAPAQLLERLDHRFLLLTGGRRRVPRQQTLAATLAWSYDLLHPGEQVLLRRLAVLPATFSLDAAERVTDTPDIVEPLGSLVAKSLVDVVDDGERLRYRLLETVRLYAENLLAEAGEAERYRARHAAWVLDWLESTPLEARLLGDLDVLAVEHANIHAALEWSASQGDAQTVVEIAAGVDWSRSETWRAAARRCEEVAVKADDFSPHLQVQLYVTLSWLAGMAANDGGIPWTNRALEAARGEPSALHAVALTTRGRDATIPALDANDAALMGQAIEWIEAGVAMSETFAAPWQMYCRLVAGMTYAGFRDVTAAEAHFAAGVAASPALWPYLDLHTTLCAYLALTRLVGGDPHGALAVLEGRPKDTGVPYWRFSHAVVLVAALGATGQPDAARQALRAYHETIRDIDWRLGPESVVLHGGVLAGMRGEWATAARLLAAGAACVYRSPADSLLYFTFRDRVRAALGADRSRRLREEGRAMPLAQALALALGPDTASPCPPPSERATGRGALSARRP